MGFVKAKATATGILPEFSKFYCHPGKAGGTPGILDFKACTHMPLDATLWIRILGLAQPGS